MIRSLLSPAAHVLASTSPVARALAVCLAAAVCLWLARPAAAQDHAPEQPAAADHGDPAADHGAAEHAGDHEEVGAIPSVKQGLVVGTASLIVFLVVLAALSTMVWPKIVKGLDDRERKIKDEIEAAERARQQAKDALAQYEKSLAEARAEAKRMLDQTKADQQKFAAELRAKADAELTQLKDRARRDIEAAQRAALAEVYAQSSLLAASLAGKILQRELTPRDQDRMLQDSLRELSARRR